MGVLAAHEAVYADARAAGPGVAPAVPAVRAAALRGPLSALLAGPTRAERAVRERERAGARR